MVLETSEETLDSGLSLPAMPFLQKTSIPLLGLVMAVLIGVLGYRAGQSDFGWIAASYFPLFLIYGWIISRSWTPRQVYTWLGVGILLRAILWFSMPQLSDDVYRFIWDGRLILAGYNPFDQLPSWYLEEGHEVPGLSRALFEKLNSPNYFTIYPPVAQASFALAVWLFPNSELGSALVMKSFLLAAELGTLLYVLPRLLKEFGLPADRLLLYALNPMILMEVMGNLHYEGAMIFFLLLALLWLQKGRVPWAALAMALSVASKLLPLMFLPFLIRRLGWRRSLLFFSVLGAALLLLFAPLLSSFFLHHFGSSLDLYFRKFEYNASVYYLARWIGYQRVGYNLIAENGPMLAAASTFGILLYALLDRNRHWSSLPSRWLFAISLYLFLATTVHPWYSCLPVVLCLFTSFRYPLLWSGLIFLTYINYSYHPYRENLWVVALEYAAVWGYLIYEWAQKQRQQPFGQRLA